MSVGYFGTKSKIKKTETEVFQTESANFKVAIISDSQLPPTQAQLDEDDTFLINLKNALTVIKNNDVDMILYAGDIGDLGTRFAFQTYMDAIDEVFGENKPIIQTIMGNHDYWHKSVFTAINHRKAFQQIMGQSPWTHYVVNGYHFIGVSPDCGSMTAGYVVASQWLDEELQKAEADSNGKPIFVMTHNQPKNTSYGSEDWGDRTLNAVLEKHPNVINFSGHVHYSLLDERSVWQGEYTVINGKPIFVMTHNQPLNTSYGSEDWGDRTLNAVLEKHPNVINFSGHVHYSLLDERSVWQGEYTVINTQSLSYTELEEGKENGTIPPNAAATPMGYIMEFQEDEILLHRINFADGNMGKEEKTDMLWSFPLPYVNDGRFSFETRKAANQAPVVTNTAGTATLKDGNVELSFTAAEDDDFVHSYKVIIDDKETKYFFSDFYNGIADMQKDVTLTLPAPTDGTKHTYKIYAVDSWDEESTNHIGFDSPHLNY